MANKNTIAVELVVNDNGSVTVKRFAQNAGQSFDSVRSGAEAASRATDSLTSSALKLVTAFVSFQTISNTIQKAIDYLATIETATLGIASAYMTGGKYLDAVSGKALSAERALAAAQADSKRTIDELRVANLQTIATLDELVRAYQVTLPVALAKGFDRKQVQAFTVAMVQAAGAIGLQMNQLAEETRSLLTGNINPRDSRIAMVLGLRPEDIREHSRNATELFNFLMDKLAAYRIAGIESQDTWAGLWSNFKDILQQTMGMRLEPLFDVLKYELKLFSDNLYEIDEKTRTIKWNPEFLESINNFRSGLDTIIAQLYRIGMLADKFGGSISGMASMIPGNTEGAKRNAMYLERYKTSEKALQDMSMRELGWKPMTPAMDKQMRDAALKGKKVAQQMMVNVGDPENFTGQLLRYYKEIDQNVKWNPGKPAPSGKGTKEAQREEEQILASLTKQNKTHYDAAVAEAKSAAELKIKQGENVYDTNMELYSKEQKALTAWYNEQADIINETFDKTSVKEEKLHALYMDYSKKWDTNENEKQRKTEEYNQKRISTEAELYKTVNQYSDESIAAEIAALEVKYLKEKGYIRNTTLLEEAKAEKTRQIYARRDKAQLDYYQKTGVYAQAAADTIKRLADDEYRQVLKATGDEKVAAKAKADYEIEANLKMAEASDDFFKGMEAQRKKDLQNQLKWGKAGAELMKSVSSSMERGFSDMFFDSLTGKFKSLGEYFNSFKESILRNFADLVGRIATQKITAFFTTEWTPGGTSVIGYLAKAVGYVGSFLEDLDLGQYLGVDFNQGGRVSYDDGGRVAGRARYPGDHPGNDVVPAWLSPGEVVVRRTSVNSDTAEILDYINKYGRVPWLQYYLGGIAGMVTRQPYRGYSGYDYYSMSQREREANINALLRMLGADMSLYSGADARSKYSDILSNFATDSGPTIYGWNTNVFNRWGLPNDYYWNFVIPYLQAEAPIGAWPYMTKQFINDIGTEYGSAYDIRKKMMDADRRSKSGSFLESLLNESALVPFVGTFRSFAGALTNSDYNFFDKLIKAGGNIVAPDMQSVGEKIAPIIYQALPSAVRDLGKSIAPILGYIVGNIPGVAGAKLITDMSTGLWQKSPSRSAIEGGTAALAAYVANYVSTYVSSVFGPMAGPEGGGELLGNSSFPYSAAAVQAASKVSGNIAGNLIRMAGKSIESMGFASDQAAAMGNLKISAQWGNTDWLFALLSDMNGIVGKTTAFSAANGLDYVPYDGYLVKTHKGEGILTAEENKERRSGRDRGRRSDGNTYNFYLYSTVTDVKSFKKFAKEIRQEIIKIDNRTITVNA